MSRGRAAAGALALALASVGALAGCGAADGPAGARPAPSGAGGSPSTTSTASSGSVPPSASETGPPPAVAPAERPAPVGARSAGPVAASAPVSVEIPALGVSSPLEPLGLDPDGAVAAPTEWQVAGWFAEGVQPGQLGPAVVAGHVDSREGPAVFHRLDDLVPGDEVLVGRADGSTLRFVVTGSGTFEKDRFPSELVYGPATEPALRLVTCGGVFDAGSGHYRSNVVVFAALADA